MLTLSVVSHGHARMLERLLRQLDEQPSLEGVRVVVTLNIADEAFDPPDCRRLTIVTLRNIEPRGFGANHNAAFLDCHTPWFAVLNPDLLLEGEEPFTLLMRSGAEAAHIGVVAPRVVNSGGGPEDSVRGNLTPWSLAARQLLGRRKPLSVDGPARRGQSFFWLAGMCLLLNTAAFRAVGGFDERFFLYCEDYDLCARLYNAGYALKFEPQARIVHEAQRDSHRSLRHLRWHLAGLAKVWTSAAFWRVTLASLSKQP
jgi:N-acetylglucosaminyl-diphospho-decaprenol L-rhamnosyltransferase